jgi:hypothetical protein
MRIVAGRWAVRKGKGKVDAALEDGVREVEEGMEKLAV